MFLSFSSLQRPLKRSHNRRSSAPYFTHTERFMSVTRTVCQPNLSLIQLRRFPNTLDSIQFSSQWGGPITGVVIWPVRLDCYAGGTGSITTASYLLCIQLLPSQGNRKPTGVILAKWSLASLPCSSQPELKGRSHERRIDSRTLWVCADRWPTSGDWIRRLQKTHINSSRKRA